MKEGIKIQVAMILYVRIGDLRARVWFGVVNGLATSRLLGMYFIDHLVKGILTKRSVYYQFDRSRYLFRTPHLTRVW